MNDLSQLISSSNCSTRRWENDGIFSDLKKNIYIAFRNTKLVDLGQLIDSQFRSVAIALVGGYQRYISPRKGYSCAHRMAHGGDSCSQYIKNALSDTSLFEVTLLANQRFRDCNLARIHSKRRVNEIEDSLSISLTPEDPIGLIIFLVVAVFTFVWRIVSGKGCCW
jgi:putative component of membrane protein insertase Oxa1/YidC/SpoIIIJ protein YidD